MKTRPIQQLSDTLARRVVTHCIDCLKRAEISSPAFAASYPSEGYGRAYDTIVIEFQPPLGPVVVSQSGSGPAQTPAELVREALLLLRALSCCPGYSFHENFALWNAMLTQADPPTGAMPAKKGLRFPRVVLDWNPRYKWGTTRDVDHAASLRLFESSVLALFTTPSSRRLSRDGQKLLSSIREFQVSLPVNPIECAVSIRFAKAARATKVLVDSMISSATAITTQATEQSQIRSEFAWVAVRLAGSRDIANNHPGLVTLANLKLLRRLCVSLPPSIPFDFSLPRFNSHTRHLPTEPPREPLTSFLMLAIGFSGTELLGRLTVLDLTYVPNVDTTIVTLDFASLCTLLPYSRSLQTLRVTANSRTDLFWIAYAVTHPLTPTTQWRTLHLENIPHWPQLDHLVASSSLLAALWGELANSSTTSTTTTDAEALPDHYVWRTAKISHDVQFFSQDKTKTFVQLVHGQDVELCDTTTPVHELVLETGDPDLDDVAVVVAGVGLGWVHKRHLTHVTDMRHDGTPRSCLTTLVLAFHDGNLTDMRRILSVFGPALTHLSAHRGPRFAIGDVARTCPQLETLEMAVPRQVDDLEANELPSMPCLRYMGVVCGDLSSFCRTARWLQTLPCLDTIRVQFDRHFTVDEAGWNVIEAHSTRLVVARARTLRSLTIIYASSVTAAQVGVDDRLSCDAASKRTLLGVLQCARDDARGSQSAIACVGSDIVRLIFDFAGPSLARRVLKAYDMWPSDWYSHSSRY